MTEGIGLSFGDSDLGIGRRENDTLTIIAEASTLTSGSVIDMASLYPRTVRWEHMGATYTWKEEVTTTITDIDWKAELD